MTWTGYLLRHGWRVRPEDRPGRTGYRADRHGVTMSARQLHVLARMIDTRHAEERETRAVRDSKAR